MIIYPGRFQPPHSGHIHMYKEIEKRFGNTVISLDVRSPDVDNPYSFEYRKAVLVSRGVPAEQIGSHDTTGCKTPKERAERLLAIYPDMTDIAIGPDTPVIWEKYWTDQGIAVHMASRERYGNFSGAAERNKGISIITDFGCSNDCSFCIWKAHSLNKSCSSPPAPDFGLLSLFLTENAFKGKVSISGGGDPLFRYAADKSMLEPYLQIAENAGLEIDIHTRERIRDDSLWKRVRTCVFSLDEHADEKTLSFLKYVSGLSKLRIATVVQSTLTYENAVEMSNLAAELGARMTFKELYGYAAPGRFAELKQQFEKEKNFSEVLFLEKGDYNVCFMPDNSIRGEYFF